MMNLRKSSFKFGRIFCVVAIMTFLFAKPAHAYADPGTGGLIYQIVIVFLAFIASYFAFLKDFFRRAFKRGSEKNPDDEDQQS